MPYGNVFNIYNEYLPYRRIRARMMSWNIYDRLKFFPGIWVLDSCKCNVCPIVAWPYLRRSF